MNIQEQIDELQGTCASFDPTVWSDIDLQTLDDQIFNCGVCGWWCEIFELSESDTGELICTDCYDPMENEN